MDFTIASILTLDGVTNGAIYALLALATVLVFAVTRVIFIPQGEFVAYGALTLALLQLGQVPGTLPACSSASVSAPKATNSPCGMKITRVTAKTSTVASASSA